MRHIQGLAVDYGQIVTVNGIGLCGVTHHAKGHHIGLNIAVLRHAPNMYAGGAGARGLSHHLYGTGGFVLVLQLKLIRIINIPFYILIGGVCRVHIGLNQHAGAIVHRAGSNGGKIQRFTGHLRLLLLQLHAIGQNSTLYGTFNSHINAGHRQTVENRGLGLHLGDGIIAAIQQFVAGGGFQHHRGGTAGQRRVVTVLVQPGDPVLYRAVVVDRGGLAGGLVGHRFIIGVARPQILGIAVCVRTVQQAPGNVQIIGLAYTHRVHRVGQRLLIADIAVPFCVDHRVAEHPPGFAGYGKLFGSHHLIGSGSRRDGALLTVCNRAHVAPCVTTGDDTGFGIYIGHTFIRGGPGNIRNIGRNGFCVRNGHLDLGALLHRIRTGNVKVRTRHTVYNVKRDGIIIFQFEQNVGDDLHRSSRQLYSIGRIAHNILNGKASVQQRRQHIAVNVDTQILDQNIRQFFGINGAGMVQLVNIVDQL